MVEIKVIVGNPDSKQKVELKGLVDTGATLTVLPRNVADSLKILPKTKGTVMTTGGPIGIDISSAEIQIGEKMETVRIAISDVIDRVLIGITSLEILGLSVDPVTGGL